MIRSIVPFLSFACLLATSGTERVTVSEGVPT